MRTRKKALGTLFGVALSLIMFSTQVYAAGNADYSELPADEQIVFDTEAETAETLADEVEEISEETENVVLEESEVSEDELVVSEELDEDVELQEGLFSEENLYYSDALPPAENAKWTKAGWIEFTMPKTGVYYSVFVKGPNMVMQDLMGFKCDEPGQKQDLNVCHYFVDEGIYSFCVNTTEQPQNYSYRGESSTPYIEFNYKRPSICYTTPTNLRWVKNGVAKWDAADGEMYAVTFYKNGERYTTTYATEKQYEDKWGMLGEGNWTFTVTTVSKKPDEIAASAPSELSPVYVYGTELPDDVDETLPLATNLYWDKAGNLAFTSSDPDVYYSVQVQTPSGTISNYTGNYRAEGEEIRYLVTNKFRESGVYKFRVKTTKSNNDNDFSSGAITDWCEIKYDRPEQTYETPTELWWTKDGVAHWNDIDSHAYYGVELLKDGNSYSTSYIWGDNVCDKFKNYVTQSGNWAFRVYVYGYYPETIGASEWSEVSPVFDTATAREPVVIDLSKATNLEWKQGSAYFTSNSSEAYYSLELRYPDDRTPYYISGMKAEVGEEKSVFFSPEFLTAGTYRFRVKTTEKKNDTDFINGVVTDWCEIKYDKPEQTLQTPTNIWWTKDGVSHWEEKDRGSSYICRLYRDGKYYAKYQYCWNTDSYTWNGIDLDSADWTFTVQAYCNDPWQIGASEESAQSPVFDVNTAKDTEEKPDINGLAQDKDGNWYLYENGRVVTSYNGFYDGKDLGWWLVLKGRVALEYNDLYEATDHSWWMVVGGKIDFTYTGDFESPLYGGKWHVENGKMTGPAEENPDVDKKNGLAEGENGNWYLYENGKVVENYNGFYDGKDLGWWLVLKGRVAFEYNDLYEAPDHSWWMVVGGKIDFSYTGDFESPLYGGKWHVENGKMTGPAQDEPDVHHTTGLADGGDGNWYLYKDGQIVKDFSGLYEDATYGWWLVLEGRVALDYNDAYGDATYGWWKIKGGQVDFGFTGNFVSAIYGGTWYFENGQLIGPAEDEPDVSHDTGFADGGDGNWYLYENGQIAKDFSGLYEDASYGWWLVLEGRVAFEFDDIYGDEHFGWWKVAGGQVDFGFSNLYESKLYGWWLITNGAVDFGYSDVYNSPSYGYWKVEQGQVDFGFNGVYNSQRFGQFYVENGAAYKQ